MSVSGAKVSAVVATGFICLALGAGAGAMGIIYFGRSLMGDTVPVGAPGSRPNGQGGAGGGGGMGGGGRPGGMGGMGGGGAGRGGPISKRQLTSLVAKLDVLTKKPLAVTLNDEQAKKIREQLAGLDDKAELTEEEAKKRLDAILEIVEKQKETMEAAGYMWPGQPVAGAGGPGGGRGAGGRGGQQTDPNVNPFKDEQNATHLKSLQEKLGKASTSGKPA